MNDSNFKRAALVTNAFRGLGGVIALEHSAAGASSQSAVSQAMDWRQGNRVSTVRTRIAEQFAPDQQYTSALEVPANVDGIR